MSRFPASGSSSWNQAVQIFASPTGSDSNNGNNPAKPFKTAYAAAAALVAQGGGYLNLDDNCEIGGPVSGQGLWFRGDGFDCPGWLQAVPMVITGYGKSEGAGPFQPPVACKIIGGGGRQTPPIWVAATNASIRFEYLTPKFPHQVECRFGVDYIRKTDGTLMNISVSSATRAGATTVYTITLPSAITVLSAQRTSNVTTLTITNPGMPYIPFITGSKIRFASTDEVKFPSGDYTVTASGNPIANNTTWSISYADAGTNQTLSNPGTVKTHGMQSGDLFDLVSTNSHFFSTQYRVDSATIDTITVTDVFGDGDATASNIGTVVRQERFLSYASPSFFRCGFGLDETDSHAGPSVDVGHSQGILPILQECWITGYVGDGTGPRDEDRMAALLLEAGNAGSIGPAAPSVRLVNCNGSNGTVQVNSRVSDVGYVNINYLLMEANYPALQLPVLRVNGSQYTRVVGRDIYNADNAANVPTVIVNGTPLAGTDFKRCGVITGSVVGGDYWLEPSQWSVGTGIPNPWVKGQIAPWADGRITGKHPGASRAFGVMSARFPNLLLPPSSWSGAHLTKTTGQTAPDGSSGAVRLQNSVADYVQMKSLGADGNTWEVGGKLVVNGFVNSTSDNDFVPAAIVSIVSGGEITFSEGNNYPVPFRGKGWQPIQAVFTVAALSSSTPAYYPALYLGSGSDAYAYGWTAQYIPPSVNDNDAYEFAGTARPMPFYLQAGMAGTMEGVKLVAHGGLATAKYYTVGGGAGQITIGAAAAKAIEVFDENGNSLGVLRPNAFTVN